ncbi:MAG: UDP-3-O-[3-hydroxymyristoyl] glucosamine N-acyltransferase [Candidatus Magnetoglobus multicellularis str. Araruama]|uniref:UDP-3-O-acylglucosamine N-acyltransferase n=1 Tax=Candidatus Magnetoglobus multicellularis str. Araruama TaxID=890399 RepID=A0A1V1PIA5_9BACT|nr:MAG: UDP-3-O-[3-hydroxymyristoyl] glucosamine N-acyltransferase [Candidatus Magnetoglobus multicellularis str. Araruama]
MTTKLGDLVKKLEAQLKNGNPEMDIEGIAPFDHAQPGWITFAIDKKILPRINDTRADAIICGRQFENRSDIKKALIIVDNPYAAFAKAARLFLPPKKPALGVHHRATLGESVSLGSNISIHPGVVIGNNVSIGNNVTIRANTVIGDSVTIGDDTLIYPNVTILNHCQIGARVIIHSGTVVGCDGFGFAPDGDIYEKVPQTGIVRIDDDVELGANNTIDRATFGQTWIKQGVKTDNQVHIAHNVIVGENSVLVAQVGIAGSTKLGKHCVVAGQAGVSGHLTIGDQVTIGPKAGVAQSLKDHQVVSGNVAMPHKVWLKVQNIIPKLPDLKKQVARLERMLIKK